MSRIQDLLYIGRSALLAQRIAEWVTQHNIANANTPGYTRQEAVLSPGIPIRMVGAPDLLGTGVEVERIRRMRDIYLDARFWYQQGVFSHWEMREKSLKDIEEVLSPTAGPNLSDVLTEFWMAWQDLANDPENMAVRQALIDKADMLCREFHRLYSHLTDIQRMLDEDVKIKVDRINTIIKQIAKINEDIAKAGGNANDLLDKRDKLVDELAKYVNVRADLDEEEVFTVRIGGLIVVQGREYVEIGLQREETGWKLVYTPTGKIMDIEEGEIKGIYEVRDEIIPDFLNKLNTLASTIINEVNRIHRTGYALDGITTGLDFFDGTDASDIEVRANIVADPSLIAASADGSPGNNGIALQIADLQYKPIMNGGTESFSKYYNSLLTKIGNLVQDAEGRRQHEEAFLTSLEDQKQQIEGVDLDEEMLNLMKYQYAYEAAVKMINITNEMIDELFTIIS